jgi:hypothetical protein
MDITVYLPDEIGARAKAADLKFSRLLRDAVTGELDRREALEAARDGMVKQRVQASEDRHGENPVVLRFTGRALAGGFETTVWLLEDGRVLVVGEGGYDQFADAEEYGDWVHDWEARRLDLIIRTSKRKKDARSPQQQRDMADSCARPTATRSSTCTTPAPTSRARRWTAAASTPQWSACAPGTPMASWSRWPTASAARRSKRR